MLSLLRKRVAFVVSHWRPYACEAPVLVLLTLCSSALLVYAPVLVKGIVDGIVTARGAAALVRQAAWLSALGAAQVVVYAAVVLTRVRMNLRFDYGVRTRALEHLLSKGIGFFTRYRTGDIVTRLTDDVSDKLAWFMCSGFFRLFEACTVIAFGAVMMVRLDARLALVAAAPMPLLVCLYVATAGRLERRFGAVQAAISAEGEALDSCFSGVRIVKAFAAEAQQERIVGSAVERQRRAELAAVRWQTLVDTLYGQVWQLGIVGVLLVGGAAVLQGRSSLGAIVAFDAYVLMLVPPMFDVAAFLVRGRASAVSMGRIAEIEEAPREVADGPGEAPRARRPGEVRHHDVAPTVPQWPLGISFEHVAYAYPGSDRNAVEDVWLGAGAGSLLAITGPVASGKSTLLALVPRLHDPSQGRVLVGGVDVRRWDPAALRRAVALAPQEPFLFSTTIAENVRLSRPWVTEGDARWAVAVAGLAEEVDELPEGLATRVGPRGVRLSGGQKQRVTLARAIAGRPAVLCLDDVTASLDAATEAAVWERLRAALPAATILVVTHRKATLQRASKAAILEGGRLVGDGRLADFAEPRRSAPAVPRLSVCVGRAAEGPES